VKDFVKSEGKEYWDNELLKELAKKAGVKDIKFFKALIRCIATGLGMKEIYKGVET